MADYRYFGINGGQGVFVDPSTGVKIRNEEITPVHKNQVSGYLTNRLRAGALKEVKQEDYKEWQKIHKERIEENKRKVREARSQSGNAQKQLVDAFNALAEQMKEQNQRMAESMAAKEADAPDAGGGGEDKEASTQEKDKK